MVKKKVVKKVARSPPEKVKDSRFTRFLTWLVGVLVVLVVGNGMIDGTLKLPGWLLGNNVFVSQAVMFAGWVVMVTTLLGVFVVLWAKFTD